MRGLLDRLRAWRRRRHCRRHGHGPARFQTYFEGRTATAIASCSHCGEFLGAGVDTIDGPLRRELGYDDRIERKRQPRPTIIDFDVIGGDVHIRGGDDD